MSMMFCHFFERSLDAHYNQGQTYRSFSRNIFLFGSLQHIGKFHIRMVVPFPRQGCLLELDSLFRAPLDTTQARFAMVPPYRPAFDHFDIADRADPGAHTASAAFVIGPEIFIDVRAQLSLEVVFLDPPGKQKRHDWIEFHRRAMFFSQNVIGDPINLLFHVPELPVLQKSG